MFYRKGFLLKGGPNCRYFHLCLQNSFKEGYDNKEVVKNGSRRGNLPQKCSSIQPKSEEEILDFSLSQDCKSLGWGIGGLKDILHGKIKHNYLPELEKGSKRDSGWESKTLTLNLPGAFLNLLEHRALHRYKTLCTKRILSLPSILLFT